MAIEKLDNIVTNVTEKMETLKHVKEKTWPQILAILAVSLGPLTTGFMFVWSSPFTTVITQDKVNYNITEEDATLFMTFHPLGTIAASFVLFKLTEILGKKKSVMLVAFPQLLCWIITYFARTKWDFYIARFIAGMADTAMFCSVPAYVGEISTPTVRGVFGNVPIFLFYGGCFFITIIGSYYNVQTSTYICIGIPILFVLSVSLLPESPYQLIKNGQIEEAKQSIQWLRRKSNIENDFLQLQADVERQISESSTWMDLIKIPSNRRALRAGIFIRVSQQFCGIATFSSYAQTIFEKAGGNLSPQYSSMIFSGLIWIMNLFCSFSVEKYGRKPSYFYSLLSSAFILLCMAVYFSLEQFQLANLDQLNWFPLAAMIVYVFTYSFGLGVIPTLMLGELFSASIKSKALAVLMVFFGLAVLVSVGIFHLLSSSIGLYSPFLLYSICCFFSTYLTLKWVPETKGRTLEEIQQSLKKS